MKTTTTRHAIAEIGRFLSFARSFSENYLTLLIASVTIAYARTTMYPKGFGLQIGAAAGWTLAVLLFWLLCNYRMRFYCTRCRELAEDDAEFPGLLSKVRELADRGGIQLKRVVIASPKPLEDTGYRFVSLGKGMSATGEIALADALLRVLPEDEQLAVAAHELGHLSRKWPLYNPLYYPAVGAAMGVAFASHPYSLTWPLALGLGLHLIGRIVNSPRRPMIQMILAQEHKLADHAAMDLGVTPEQMLKAHFRKSIVLLGDSSALKIIMDWSSTPHGRYLVNYLSELGGLSDDQVYDLAKDVIRDESNRHAWGGDAARERLTGPAEIAS